MLKFNEKGKWLKAIDDQDVDKIHDLLKNKTVDFLFEIEDDMSLIEIMLLTDGFNQNHILTQYLFQNFNIDILKRRLSSGNTLLEDLFIKQDFFCSLKYLLEIKAINPCDPYKKENLITTNVYLAIMNSNIRVIQYLFQYQRHALYSIDSLNNTFLPYAILKGNSLILDFILLLNLNPEYKNIEDKTQIEAAFNFFAQNINDYHFLKEKRQEVTLNFIHALKTLYGNFNDFSNPFFETSAKLILNAINSNNFELLKVLTEKFLFKLNFLYQNMLPVDFAAKNYNVEMCNFITKFQFVYKQDLVNQPNTDRFYVSYVSSAYTDPTTFNIHKFTEFYNQLSTKWNLNVPNALGNNFLHSVCAIMKDNFELYFPLFKFFLEKGVKLEKNNDGKLPYMLIKNKEDRYNALLYLSLNGHRTEDVKKQLAKLEKEYDKYDQLSLEEKMRRYLNKTDK